MSVPLERAQQVIEEAAGEIFAADPSVRSVGVTRLESSFGFRAVRNSSVILPFSAASPPLREVFQVPIVFADTPGEIESMVMVPDSGPASPAAASLIPEVQRSRPLVAGLQIQNFDDDSRQGILHRGLIVVGTLGCFVRLANGSPALLSNNHVVAGENRGQRRTDRILQPGSGTFQVPDQIALLEDFVLLQGSPPGATPKQGTALLNDVDAGVAALAPGVSFRQGYLPSRKLTVPHAIAAALPGDQVFKVGRTTRIDLRRGDRCLDDRWTGNL